MITLIIYRRIIIRNMLDFSSKYALQLISEQRNVPPV